MRVYLDEGQKMVDSTVSYALNIGVVGALLLSITLPFALEDVELSEDRWSFLNDEAFEVVSWVLRASFVLSLHFAIYCSLRVITIALVTTLALTQWSTSLEAKMEWHVARASTLRGLAVLNLGCFLGLLATVCAGGMLKSPLQGGIGFIFCSYFFRVWITSTYRETVHARRTLHAEAVEFFGPPTNSPVLMASGV
tara:strand:+ start:396 stop:980 length:585 start_codon:yes stop_codon:yes gene_type:complete